MNKFKHIISAALIASLSMQPILAENTLPTNDRSAYHGEGMCIAIIDTGFDLEHETFVLTDPSPRLTKDSIDALIPSLSIGSESEIDCYVNEKIPFAYDYANRDTDVSSSEYHGTAMLSLVAGNGGKLEEPRGSVYGSAPEAQILAMKVGILDTGYIDDTAFEAAIYDAVLLGADVILLPLGNPCGFATDDPEIHEAIKTAADAGVIVVAGAGNVRDYGEQSVYAEEYAISKVATDIPDVGTIAHLGVFPEVFTVGSSNNNMITSDSIILADGTVIPYSDSNYLYEMTTNFKTFASYFKGQSLEYVITDGLGSPEDLQKAGDLTGRFAVIERGTLAFYDKAANAAALGAIGVIITDNQPDPNAALQTRMDLSESPIPAILVSGYSGDALAAAEEKFFTIGGEVATEIRETPMPSDFTSFGTTPELLLKPNIVAVGESVECAAADNAYTTVSSTSASAATVAGLCACVKQYLAERFPELSPVELAAKTQALLVSSAVPMTSHASTPYSPRTQGGGSANLEAALSSKLLLTSNGTHQISVGDGHNRLITFSLTAENLSDEILECKLDAIVGSDGFNNFTFDQLDNPEETDGKLLSERLGKLPTDTVSFISDFTPFTEARVSIGSFFGQLNTAAADYDPFTLTLQPRSSSSVLVSVMLSLDEYARYSEHFENGFFIEGFMRLTSGEETASLPFVGYSGNYYATDALDADLYEGEQPIYEGCYLYRFMNDENLPQMSVALGGDPFSKWSPNAQLSADELILSPVADQLTSTLYLNLGLRRSITDVNVTVTNDKGETVSKQSYGSVARTYVDARTGMLTCAVLPLWDGRADDHFLYVYPDGKYRITLTYRLAADAALHKLTYDLTLDSEAPRIESTEFSIAGVTQLLTVSATDNNRVHTIKVTDYRGNVADETASGVFDLTYLSGEYIYIEVYDSALNYTITRVKNLYSPLSDND